MLQINLRKILADRKAPVPGFVARLLEKIICQDELNATLRATTPSEARSSPAASTIISTSPSKSRGWRISPPANASSSPPTIPSADSTE